MQRSKPMRLRRAHTPRGAQLDGSDSEASRPDSPPAHASPPVSLALSGGQRDARAPAVRRLAVVERGAPAAGPLTRDAVTGAYSRALFETRLRAEVERACREAYDVSLCMLDLDYFKSVNDAYGHRRGDQVLRELVRRLHAGLRRSDLLFRYGGDEFVLVLPRTGKAQATVLAERLLQQVRAEPFSGEPPLSLTISVGVACGPEEGTNGDALLDLADRRHFDAKRRGRANVVADDASIATESPREPARLIERDGALQRLHHFLAKLAETERGVLVVTGQPGSGRTRFLATAAQEARQRGYGVMALPNQQPAPAHGSSPERLHLEGDLLFPPASRASVESLTQAMRGAQTRHGYTGWLLAIDQTAEADDAALRLAGEILKSDELGRVVLAYTADAGQSAQPAAKVPEAAYVETVELRPLSTTGVSIWLRSLLHLDPPAAFADWLQHETEGRPALLHKAVGSLIEQGMLRQDEGERWSITTDYSSADLTTVVGDYTAPPPHNLPAPLTDFIGREVEMRLIGELLARRRLVTLVGPGGIGKTRLALGAAEAALTSFADGVAFVPLASISDPELVPIAIAAALQVKEVSGKPILERLKEFLHDREQLLLLDNFEQVVAAAPVVSELLRAAPQVKVLATSREPLRLYGEQVFPVPPLDLPDLAESPSVDVLTACAAPALFASRAQAVSLDFSLNEENARTVAELCVRLDGLPLAIELAAARCAELTPRELLSQMSSRLALLTDGPRDLPARQQTLRGAIEWGYQLLSPAEQWLFAELAVFAGSFSVEAAQAVHRGQEGSEPLKPDELRALADKSLLRRESEPDGQPAYAMLETIREYAQERLEARGDAEATRRRHADYFLTLAETANEELKGADQKRWLDRLEREHDNLRAALAWALRAEESEIAGRFGLALWRFWEQRGRATEGRGWFDAILKQGDALPPALRAHVLTSAGVLAWYMGDYPAARALLEAGLTLGRQLGDHDSLARALNNLGLVARQQGDFDEARGYFEECLRIDRERGNDWGVSVALGNLGRLALLRGDPAAAQPLIEESLAISRGRSDLANMSLTLRNLGLIHLSRHDYEHAIEFFDEALLAAEEVGNRRNTAAALACLGITALRQGDRERAATLLRDTLARWCDLGYKEGIAEALEALGGVAGAWDRPRRAAQLFGAAEALREAIGVPISPFIRASYQQLVDLAKDQPSPAAWKAAWNEGRRASLERILDEELRTLY